MAKHEPNPVQSLLYKRPQFRQFAMPFKCSKPTPPAFMDNPPISRNNNGSNLRIKSIADYKEEVKELHNENFSLKLEIYNLREKLGQILGNDEAENVISKLSLESENKQLEEKLAIKDKALENALIALTDLQEKFAQKEKVNADLIAAKRNLESKLERFSLQSDSVGNQSFVHGKTLNKAFDDVCTENDSLKEDLYKAHKTIGGLVTKINDTEEKPLFKLLQQGTEAAKQRNVQCVVSCVDDMKNELCDMLSMPKNEVFPDLNRNSAAMNESLTVKDLEIKDLKRKLHNLQEQVQRQQRLMTDHDDTEPASHHSSDESSQSFHSPSQFQIISVSPEAGFQSYPSCSSSEENRNSDPWNEENEGTANVKNATEEIRQISRSRNIQCFDLIKKAENTKISLSPRVVYFQTEDSGINKKQCIAFGEMHRKWTNKSTNRPLISTCDISSDSDAWSEPDKMLSFQRVGIELRRNLTQKEQKRNLNRSLKKETNSLNGEESFTIYRLSKVLDNDPPVENQSHVRERQEIQNAVENILEYLKKAGVIGETNQMSQTIENVSTRLMSIESVLTTAVQRLDKLVVPSAESTSTSADNSNWIQDFKATMNQILETWRENATTDRSNEEREQFQERILQEIRFSCNDLKETIAQNKLQFDADQSRCTLDHSQSFTSSEQCPQCDSIRNQCEQRITEAKTQYEKLETSLKNEILQLRIEMQDLQQSVESLEEEKNVILKNFEKLDNAKRSMCTIDHSLDINSKEQCPDCSNARNESEKIMADAIKQREDIEKSHQKERLEYENRISQLNQLIQTLQVENEEKDNSLQKSEESCSQLRLNLHSVEHHLHAERAKCTLQHSFDIKPKEPCPDCINTQSQSKKKLTEMKKEMDKEIKGLKSEIEDLNVTVEQLKGSEKLLQKRLESSDEKFSSSQDDLKATKEELDSMKLKCEACDDCLIKSETEISELNKQIEGNQTSEIEIVRQKAENSWLTEMVKQLQDSEKLYMERLARSDELCSKLQQDLRSLKRRLKTMEEKCSIDHWQTTSPQTRCNNCDEVWQKSESMIAQLTAQNSTINDQANNFQSEKQRLNVENENLKLQLQQANETLTSTGVYTKQMDKENESSKTQIDNLNVTVEQLKGSEKLLQKRLESSDENCSKLQQELRSLKRRLKTMVEKCSIDHLESSSPQTRCNNCDEVWQKSESIIAEFTAQNSTCNDQVNSFQSENQRLNLENENLKVELQQANETLTSTGVYTKQMDTENEGLKSQIENLNVTVEQLKGSEELLQKKLESSDENCSKLQQELQSLKRRFKSMEEKCSIDHLESTSPQTRCNNCDKVRQKSESMIAQLTALNSTCNDQVNSFQSENQRLNLENENLKVELQQANKTLTSTGVSNNSLKNEIQQLQKKVSELQKDRARDSLAAAELQNRIAQLEKELKKKRVIDGVIEYSKDLRIQNLMQAVEEKNIVIYDLEAQISDYDTSMELQRRQSSLQDGISGMEHEPSLLVSQEEIRRSFAWRSFLEERELFKRKVSLLESVNSEKDYEKKMLEHRNSDLEIELESSQENVQKFQRQLSHIQKKFKHQESLLNKEVEKLESRYEQLLIKLQVSETQLKNLETKAKVDVKDKAIQCRLDQPRNTFSKDNIQFATESQVCDLLSENTDLKLELKKQLEELTVLKTNKSSHITLISELKEQLKILLEKEEMENDKHQNEKKLLEDKLQELKTELEHRTRKYQHELVRKKSENKEAIMNMQTELYQLTKECTEKNSAISALKLRISDFEQKMYSLYLEISKHEAAVACKNEEIIVLENTVSSQDENIAALRDQLNKSRAAYQEVLKRSDNRSSSRSSDSQLQKVESNNEISLQSAAITQLKTQLEESAQRIQELKSNLQFQQNALQEKETELNAVNIERSRLQNSVIDADELIKRLNWDIAHLKEQLAKVRDPEDTEQKIKQLKKALASCKKRLDGQQFLLDANNSQLRAQKIDNEDLVREVSNLRAKMTTFEGLQVETATLKENEEKLMIEIANLNSKFADNQQYKEMKLDLMLKVLNLQSQFYENESSVSKEQNSKMVDGTAYLRSVLEAMAAKNDERIPSSTSDRIKMDVRFVNHLRKFFEGVLRQLEEANAEIVALSKEREKLSKLPQEKQAELLDKLIREFEEIKEQSLTNLRSTEVLRHGSSGQFQHTDFGFEDSRFLDNRNHLSTSEADQSKQKGQSRFDSVCERSHFSSPDLGIESDPNQESAASVHEYTEKASKSDCLTLQVVGTLANYELLKKEIQECVAGIKGISARAKDGLKQLRKNSPSRKDFGQVTLSAILEHCDYLNVCLSASQRLLENFKIDPIEEIRDYETDDLRHRLKDLRAHYQDTNEQLKKAMEDLKIAQADREMYAKEAEDLIRTKKSICRTKSKLFESEKRNQ